MIEKMLDITEKNVVRVVNDGRGGGVISVR
jgi:hypothetical protein